MPLAGPALTLVGGFNNPVAAAPVPEPVDVKYAQAASHDRQDADGHEDREETSTSAQVPGVSCVPHGETTVQLVMVSWYSAAVPALPL